LRRHTGEPPLTDSDAFIQTGATHVTQSEPGAAR
jgi:hypothetical protein